MHTPTAPSLPLILQDEKDSWFKDSYWLFESSSKIYIIVYNRVKNKPVVAKFCLDTAEKKLSEVQRVTLAISIQWW